MASSSDAVLRELDGLRALARALVAGPDADDLLQDAAIAVLEHPPALDRPVRPWLAAVLRNRKRMTVRADARRRRRETLDDGAATADARADRADDAIDRARTLEKLSKALVALDEPFRTAVVRRYLDGESSAAIARALGVPAGTVRWRLKLGLERLRAALDDDSPRWRAALVPLVKGAMIVKFPTKIAIAILALLLLAGGVWLATRKHPAPNGPVATRAAAPAQAPARHAAPAIALPPGQAPAVADASPLPGGQISGRVVNWSTGDGVVDAEVSFASAAGMVAVRTHHDGGFELAPPEPGNYTLAAISAAGFLPYAPELDHSPIHVAFQKGRSVGGLTVFVYPALDYHGVVVDAANQPVAGAHVALLGSPAGEQAIDHLATEWTTAADGTFTFHAPDDAVFEADKGGLRGWARLDGGVAITKKMVIAVAAAPARDQKITGIVVDERDQPLPDVLVRARPVATLGEAAATATATTATATATVARTTTAAAVSIPGARATAFATSGADGAFALDRLDAGAYELDGDADGRAATRVHVAGGVHGVKLTVTTGVVVSGTVVTTDETPVPAFTLTVLRRDGVARSFDLAQTIVDPRGRFAVHVAPGDLELIATAAGFAPTPAVRVQVDASPRSDDVKLVVKPGATITGIVKDAASGAPIQYARVMREALGAGASAQPSNVGTVTRADGTFTLTGVPEGRASITIAADSYHPKIESGMIAKDGDTIGPVTIDLTPLAPGEAPTLDLVGIGVSLGADGDALRVLKVIPGGGAQAAGIVDGDEIVAVDGANAADLGVEGAVARIRGTEGTTVAISLRRDNQVVIVTCQRRKLRA